MPNKVNISTELLTWYDAHAREMPWRVPPQARLRGELPDPYHVWLSEVMLQQTTVAAVGKYFHDFTTRWPRIQDLAAAQDADVMAAWAGLGYYARARNLLKCARFVTSNLNGAFPKTERELMKLPGIGPYTAAAITAIAFDGRASVLDGNVERVMARIFAIENPLPGAKEELRALALSQMPNSRYGDYAQAVMDLGATICTPRRLQCAQCPIRPKCRAHAQGIAPDLPNKTPKPKKPTRHGIAYVIRRDDGALLLTRRPDRGLLGGMLCWPCTDWGDVDAAHRPPISADWQALNAEVRHTFTHFHLHLKVMLANAETAPSDLGQFVTLREFNPDALPSVMQKVWNIAKHQIGAHNSPKET
ncbi:A/G-specific adenine glycosylase [Amylibacter marinus]|uniref:Adenine DNA glycosylase n=1 Tax=Amylibacter marinus TaxID=1475483 RepID=A0ABQ5VW32_9RHOB|nr:A/G-specific adenine glycosylase [Amylibacter marinus]GLQ35648.1 A/G-specific adenine glycosylase [Amylibacter marinus]